VIDPNHARELERVRSAYEARDTVGGPALSPSDPVYARYIEGLDHSVLGALAGAGATLAGARVLEVGAGSGAVLHRLTDMGAAEGVGVELMEGRVAAARERYPALDVRQGDAAALPFGDGEFDLVTQFTCLTSVLDSGVRERIVAEMWRVLRPGGAVLSYDMRPAPALVRAARRVAARRSDPSGTPLRPLGEEELRQLFPAPPAVLETVTLNPALWPFARRSAALGAALERVPPLRSHLIAVFRKPG
jgi:SAM-dependent methyltransferase